VDKNYADFANNFYIFSKLHVEGYFHAKFQVSRSSLLEVNQGEEGRGRFYPIRLGSIQKPIQNGVKWIKFPVRK